MRLAVLGGSFDPVHAGHLFLADAVLNTLHYDRVVLIPAFRSPFKPQAVGMESSAPDRLEMLCAAAAGDSRLAVDDCELRREGISYTVDTMRDIVKRYEPEGKPALIIGDDLACDFPKWHESAVILEMADIIVARRIQSRPMQYPFPHTVMSNDVIAISSQQVRENIRQSKAWRFLVPSPVRSIIEDRGLYGFNDENNNNCTQDLIVRVENAVRKALSSERFLHSRNTALMSFDLCSRFGINPRLGYLAGIAHDYGKQLDNKLILKLVKSDNMEITAFERKMPNLLHGRAGAVLLREQFNITNKDVLEAVSLHTSGGEKMGNLAKIVYIADKVEVSRNIDPVIRKICYTENDLDAVFYMILNKTINKLKSKNLTLSDETKRLLEKMNGIRQ
jgi:nicotinate-nucleotide adenylyltransferase